MKNITTALFAIFSLSAFAGSSTGSIKVTDFVFEGQPNLRLEITGPAAKKLYDNLKASPISIDASESPNRAHTLYKNGENYSCELIHKTPVAYKCSLSTLDKGDGSVDQH